MAIPPTIIMLSNLGIKFFIMPIFVEIFDPPIIHVIGFFISVVTFFNALISVSNCNPAKDGRNLLFYTQMNELCENKKKASFT